ncbi:MAG: SagB/ThcOx family dehydrogenase [Anaerolineae bacterium]
MMVVAAVAWFAFSQRGGDTDALQPVAGRMTLPTPQYDSATSVEEALLKRRSIRDYKDAPLTLAELGQLLWAAQGITDLAGFRTAPSAGALYPMEVYAVVGNVTGLAAGVYKYRPAAHALERISGGNRLAELSKAALGQAAVRDAAVVLVLAAVYERTTQKYGERGVRYVHMEAGHVSQNVYLQAVSLGLGTVTIGAFYDEDVKKVVGLAGNEETLYLMPVGRP